MGRSVLVFFSLLALLGILLPYTLSGTVYDFEKSRLSNVNVTAFYGDIKIDEYTVDIGSYQLNVPAGTFLMRVEKSGYPVRISKVKISSNTVIDLVLYKRIASTNYVYGRVIADQLPSTVDMYQNNQRLYRDTVSENGLFLFPPVDPGLYELRTFVDGQTVTENFTVTADSFIVLRKKVEQKEIVKISDEQSKQSGLPVILVPSRVEVDKPVTGYVIPGEDSPSFIRLKELDRVFGITNNGFEFTVDTEGTYTIEYGDVTRQLTVVLPKAKDSSSLSPVENKSAEWSALDILVIFFIGIVIVVGITAIGYIYLSGKRRKKEPVVEKPSAVQHESLAAAKKKKVHSRKK